MGRCKKHRCCRLIENACLFKPAGIPLTEIPICHIGPDEFEAIRLCDHEKKSQIEAAEAMHISRGTVQRLLESGRYKIINALLHKEGIRLQNTQTGE